jgi:hypothetical protein
MNKIKGSLFSEQRLAGAIFGFLAVAAFAFIFGPNIYAQFARQTGAAGWGYGSGYGYGYGFGFDKGTTSGYRTSGGNYNLYGYGIGYGYLASDATYTAANGYSITAPDVSSLVQSGVVVPNNGASIASATQVSFTSKVTLTAGTATVTIPSGTTLTSGSAADFSQLAAASGVSTADLSGVNMIGSAFSFGLPSVGLTVFPAVPVTINVGTTYNSQTFHIYRKDAGGSWSDTATTCIVANGICSFTTTNFSSFLAGTPTSVSTTSGGGGGGGGGGSSYTTPSCTSVVYGDYDSACFSGYQYRTVTSKTPSDCTLTAAQVDNSRQACVTTVMLNGEPVTSSDAGNFIALEKSLVKKVSAALVKRLAGKIILQVEAQGQAWYVNPVDGLKYFLGTPADAFAAMRKLALGVSNKTWATFKNSKAPAKLAGRILIKVQDAGKAYYVNPTDLKLYYLGRPADAFSVMRKLGLGISNANLRQIGVGVIK